MKNSEHTTHWNSVTFYSETGSQNVKQRKVCQKRMIHIREQRVGTSRRTIDTKSTPSILST
jgi:hypothetical protein